MKLIDVVGVFPANEKITVLHQTRPIFYCEAGEALEALIKEPQYANKTVIKIKKNTIEISSDDDVINLSSIIGNLISEDEMIALTQNNRLIEVRAGKDLRKEPRAIKGIYATSIIAKNADETLALRIEI